MAIDTATKRGSAININSPWRGLWPIPDSTIDQGDRQMVAYMYSGISANGGGGGGAGNRPRIIGGGFAVAGRS